MNYSWINAQSPCPASLIRVEPFPSTNTSHAADKRGQMHLVMLPLVILDTNDNVFFK
jgi:hypothetical protein